MPKSRWVALGARRGARVAEANIHAALPPGMRRTIDAAIDHTISVGKAPGVVFGSWIPGKGSYITARGIADTATKTPMRTDMFIPIGQITRSLTATIVLQLVDEGVMSSTTRSPRARCSLSTGPSP